jgi:hypothetical protein
VGHALTAVAAQLTLWRPWRAWALALVAVALVLVPAARERTVAAFQPAASSFESLPAASQASVSRTLGRDDRGYHMTKAGNGFQAANRQQGLEARFTADGLRIRAGADRLGLSLAGHVAASPRARANRIEYRRGALTEWYVNGPLGVEQGFTLRAPPAGRSTGRIALELRLSGNLTPAVEPSGRSVTFRGSSLRYSGLTAVDAAGRELSARIEVKKRALILRVDTRGASYPIEVDPLVQQAKLTVSDGGSRDAFGHSVAIAGDTIVVGAPNATVGTVRQGAAYVFVKPASGWAGGQTEAAKLSASDGAENDSFGASVAIEGDTVVVGSLVAVDGRMAQGAAYVYVRPAGGWSGSHTQNAKLAASDGAANDLLGFPVAIAGDTIVAGAFNATVGANGGQGAAYVFTKPAFGWSGDLYESAKLTAFDGAASDYFGIGVAIAGDTIVAGAENAASAESGAAYVFVEPASGWSGHLNESARLASSDAALGFGFSVALSGATVVVGAPYTTVGPNTWQGAAYVFVKPASSWSGQLNESAKLTASDGGANDALGNSVAIAGDTVLAGAPNASNKLGAVYEFVRPPSGWSGSRTQEAKVNASDGAPGDSFGLAVAIFGDVGVAGARHATGRDNPNAGAAYVFEITPPDTTPPAVTLATVPSDQVAATGWYNKASSGTDGVRVDVSASDSSGVPNLTCTDGSTTVLDTSTGSGSLVLHDGIHSVACSARDARGNVGAGPGSTTMPVAFKVDETPPTLASAVSPNPVLLHGTATVAANASDHSPGSGLGASTVACGAVDTSSVGVKTLTCTANDIAGNSMQGQASYSVRYRFLGFSAPPANSTWRAGGPITIKYALGDVNGTVISDSEAKAIASAFRATAFLIEPGLSGFIVAGPVAMTYDAKANVFVAKLVTPKGLGADTYPLVAEVMDSASDLVGTGSELITIKR